MRSDLNFLPIPSEVWYTNSLMKCEICHTNDAQVAIEKVIGGSPRELYVCKTCAAKENLRKRDGIPRSVASVVKLVLNATEQAIRSVAQVQNTTKNSAVEFRIPKLCPNCGTTADEVTSNKQLGCSTCYKTFTSEIRSLLGE